MLYRDHLKRPCDVLLSGLSLLALSPILILTAIAIRLEDGGPALFCQQRVGRAGRRYRMFKFRSMPVNVESLPTAKASGLKITRVGQVLRRTNIDELPQLFNILKGDMSVVGPRPSLPSQEDLAELRRANGSSECRPGLTGLAQVSSYDGMSEQEKAKFDGEYASSISFRNDFRIVLRTFTYLAHRPPTY